jgi:hypothetical protein
LGKEDVLMVDENVPKVAVIPSLRFLYTSRVEIQSPVQVGPSPYGERRIIYITGGSFHGPRLSGTVSAGGADWQFVRRDGVTELDARYTLKTYDGAFISVVNWGLRHGPKDVMDRLMAGEKVDPTEYYFRTTPRFETGAEQYLWLNRIVAVGTGERRANEVVITVYEVT